MKLLLLPALLAAFALPVDTVAQGEQIKLTCPLNDAIIVPPSKNAMTFDIPDLCIVLASQPDTIVKACVNSRVTNVVQNPDDGNKWEVVIFTKFKDKEYYFWYSGLDKVNVRRNETLKQGQAIGIIRPQGTIELLMFDFETPVDPVLYLDCKNVLGRK